MDKGPTGLCGSLSKNGTQQFSFPGDLGSLRRQLPRYNFDWTN